jgi:hypothetical protein
MNGMGLFKKKKQKEKQEVETAMPKEAEELAGAVGTLLGAFDRAGRGETDFTRDEVEKIGKSVGMLMMLQPEEIIELFQVVAEMDGDE